jgi:hypothetical protein
MTKVKLSELDCPDMLFSSNGTKNKTFSGWNGAASGQFNDGAQFSQKIFFLERVV